MSNFNNLVTFKNYQQYFVNKFRDYNLDVDHAVNEEMMLKKKRRSVLTQAGYKGSQYNPNVVTKMTEAIDTEKSAIDRLIAKKLLCLERSGGVLESASGAGSRDAKVNLLNEDEMGIEISEKFGDMKISQVPCAFERDCINDYKAGVPTEFTPVGGANKT
jgi:hypothetical protein